MKKILATLLAAVSLLTVSCSKDDDPKTGSSDAGVYRITIEVSGTDAKGFAHIINLDRVNIKNENTGESSASIDDEFPVSASYVTEGKVKEISAQGMVYSNEKASVRMKVTKDGRIVFDESKSIDPETGSDKIGELRFTTVSQ
jgi:hypothetical protein